MNITVNFTEMLDYIKMGFGAKLEEWEDNNYIFYDEETDNILWNVDLSKYYDIKVDWEEAYVILNDLIIHEDWEIFTLKENEDEINQNNKLYEYYKNKATISNELYKDYRELQKDFESYLANAEEINIFADFLEEKKSNGETKEVVFFDLKNNKFTTKEVSKDYDNNGNEG